MTCHLTPARATIRSSSSTSVCISGRREITVLKSYPCPTLNAAALTTAKTWEEPKCLSTSRRLDKNMWICTRILSSCKKEILPFVTTWMGLEGLTLSEIRRAEKRKYCMISLICGIWKKNIQKKQSDLWLPEVGGRGAEGGTGWRGSEDWTPSHSQVPVMWRTTWWLQPRCSTVYAEVVKRVNAKRVLISKKVTFFLFSLFVAIWDNGC